MNNTKEGIIKYEGELDLMGFEIKCCVLEDGTSVLANKGMQETLKIVDNNSKSIGGQMARFLASKSLKPFIFKGKQSAGFSPIICRGRQGGLVSGYEATVLVDICDGMLEARKQIKLDTRQKIVADQCEILVRAFAKTGIIALVHEATGYQYEREQFELQAILKAFISEEVLEWKKTFQWTFYKEIFRLWNLPFTVDNIKRPGFIGTLTNELVYKNLPKGTIVLEKIKEKTPKTKGGHYRYRFHQRLTPEIGREELKKVINSVEALASISKDKDEFLELMERKYHSEEENIPIERKDFSQTLKTALNTPPLKLKDLKAKLKKGREKK